MTNKSVGALIASLGVVTLVLATNETLARSGATPHGGLASKHSTFRPLVGQSLRHRRNTAFLPAVGGSFYGASNGEPGIDATQPVSADIRQTYIQDVPWDWAHRYPPAVAPSERPYVPSCPTEIVRVFDRDGKEQTVSVTRCY